MRKSDKNLEGNNAKAQYDWVTETGDLGVKNKKADDVFTINIRYYF
ncbi:MAG: hypothetical protein ACR2PT_00570 [Endozoicomonas sp.]